MTNVSMLPGMPAIAAPMRDELIPQKPGSGMTWLDDLAALELPKICFGLRQPGHRHRAGA
jgi:hypothetical protein